MAPAIDAEPQSIASGCTSDQSAKMNPMQQAELNSKQAMPSLYIASQSMKKEPTTIDVPVKVDWSNVDDFLILSLCSTELIREGRDGAAMASSA